MKLKSLIVVLLCIVVCSSCEQPPIEAYAVLPQPQEINYVQGFVKLKDKPMVVYSNELSNEALLLASYLKMICSGSHFGGRERQRRCYSFIGFDRFT